MADETARLLVLGAHPDDAEFHAGGLIAAYRQMERPVKVVSVTNGGAGHHEKSSQELVRVRRGEADRVAQLLGLDYDVWPFPDGHLQATLEVRERVIREIRTFGPDLVLTHRTNDYHPDHRAVGQAVQDASFTVTVPLIVPDVPPLRRDPVVAYMADFFTKPNPLSPDVVVDITPYFDTIVDMLACHQSQVYEWLPYLKQVLDELPSDAAGRKQWLARWFAERAEQVAARFRGQLEATYGDGRGAEIAYAEAYEISEYAGILDPELRRRLFPV